MPDDYYLPKNQSYFKNRARSQLEPEQRSNQSKFDFSKKVVKQQKSAVELLKDETLRDVRELNREMKRPLPHHSMENL